MFDYLLPPLILLIAATPQVHAKNSPTEKLDTHADVSFYRETEDQTPQYVSGRLAAPARRGTEVEATLTFFKAHQNEYRMSAPEAELVLNRAETDRRGNQHLKFKQHYHGLEVIGGHMLSHFGPDGQLQVVNGFYRPDIDLDIAPAISATQATDLAQADLVGFFGPGEPQTPKLVILPWPDTYHLCWQLELVSEDPLGRWEYFVDALSGEIVFKGSLIRTSEEIGTGLSSLGAPRNHIDVWYTGSIYELRDYTRQSGNDLHGHNGQMPPGNFIQTNNAGAILPGSVYQDLDNDWSLSTQGPFVDAQVYAGVLYDWLLREFGRNSYDDQGASMLSSVNWTRIDYNAFWTGSHVVYTVCPGARSYAACPDIVAHEWAHAITDYCAGLAYYWESGAINESFSNMLGAAFEWAHDTLDAPDWLLGENMYLPSAGSMSDPPSQGRPGYYEGPYWVDIENCIPGDDNDYCGAHTNDGVGHKWFYLLSDGGTYRDVTVTGIGVENAIQIAYHANAYYWTYWTDYHDAALGTYFAALDLDPTGVWATEAANAWLAVNVDIQTRKLAFDFPLGTPRTVLRNKPTIVEMVISGLVGGVPVPGTGQIHYSVDGGGFVTEAMAQTSENHYQAMLPALDCEQTLEFYFSAEAVGGTRFYEPGPTSPLAATVVRGMAIGFADDFETDLGWTVSGDATQGIWERGVPTTDGSDGAPTSDYDGSGQCYVTGLSYRDDVEYGTTYLTSPQFDLSGTDGVIRFAWWFHNRCSPTQIAGDPLYVWVSNDDGANWSLVEVIGPNPGFEGAWRESEFVVGDFVSPSSQVRVRFEISDINLFTCVEAGVDAFSIDEYVCSEYTTCCLDRVGNANDLGDDEPTISDASTMIDAKFITGTCDDIIVCLAEADINQSGGIEPACDDITISDISILIDYLFISGPSIGLPDCL